MQLLRALILGLPILLSGIVLFVSIYRATGVKYQFSSPNDSSIGQPVFVSGVEYSLPFPGILPDNPFWFLKAFRERLNLYFTYDPLEKAERTLFLADKRLSAAEKLAQKGKYSLAIATATKAEKYLETAMVEGKNADVRGEDASGFFETLSKAALTHRQLLDIMMASAPEDAKPILNKTMDSSKSVYEQAGHFLNERGKSVLTPTPTP